MKEVADLVALADPDLAKRIRAIQDSAIGQKPNKLPALQLLQTSEKHPKAQRALKESIAIIQLRSPVPAERVAACVILGEPQHGRLHGGPQRAGEHADICLRLWPRGSRRSLPFTDR